MSELDDTNDESLEGHSDADSTDLSDGLDEQSRQSDVELKDTLVIESTDEDLPEDDCPPCKGGAPAWMATFADMATLLMAFFVLILSFAQMNVPKFKEVAGSMNDTMGVQRRVPVVEPPTADSIIAKQFMKAKVEPTAMSTISEQTTDKPQLENPELKTTTFSSESFSSSDLEVVKAALADEIARGEVEVTEEQGTISVAVLGKTGDKDSDGETGANSGSKLSEVDIALFAKVVDAQTQVKSEVQVSRSPSTDKNSVVSETKNMSSTEIEAAEGELEEIRSRLSTEISRGLVNVEMVDQEVKITLADQGSFVSGSADLQPGFFEILESVGGVLRDRTGQITVAGHTDNIPIAFSERFQSNWDLSVARSASVVDYLVGDNFVDAGRVTVAGYADTVPIASNESATGRAQNRRIEIKVKP